MLCAALAGCGSGTPHPGAKLPGPRAAIAAAKANAVTVSPLPGTPDASPATQISFLGPRGAKVLSVHAVGSRTGYHAGRIEAYSTGTGASFVPRHRFARGESVAAEARVELNGRILSVGTSFRIESRPPALAGAARAAHVLRTTRAGTAWIDMLVPVRANLARYGGSTRGVLEDAVIEEIDRATGLVMWEWHALRHVPLPQSGVGAGIRAAPWSPYAIGSVDSRGGRLLVSIGEAAKRYEIDVHSGAASPSA